ncbi:hypothetical protein [Desulfovibrio sp.]|nr:hypothetical protein [Desulfovibrio sp.]
MVITLGGFLRQYTGLPETGGLTERLVFPPWGRVWTALHGKSGYARAAQ